MLDFNKIENTDNSHVFVLSMIASLLSNPDNKIYYNMIDYDVYTADVVDDNHILFHSTKHKQFNIPQSEILLVFHWDTGVIDVIKRIPGYTNCYSDFQFFEMLTLKRALRNIKDIHVNYACDGSCYIDFTRQEYLDFLLELPIEECGVDLIVKTQSRAVSHMYDWSEHDKHVFKAVLQKLHDCGRRLFVTNNMFDEIMLNQDTEIPYGKL